MPSHVPRIEPVKKKEELFKREQELKWAIQKNVSAEKLNKVAEKFRRAQLSFFKAKIHSAKDKEYGNISHTIKTDNVEKKIVEWSNKSLENIIEEMRKQRL